MASKDKHIDYYLEGLKEGNRYILSEAITLVESTAARKNMLGIEILSKLDEAKTKTLRIGITGSPGVGKSTFLDSIGMYLIEMGFKIAILAVDPSSQKTKGSILADKTRMTRLSKNENAYIRPTASGKILGGVAANTKEAIMLCEAAGYDIIFVETVGVGQSETMVSQLVDVFILLILPGSGDDIQGIKRGIMELADIILINKADGDRVTLANRSQKQFSNALGLLQNKIEGWNPKVMTCSGLEGHGMEELWKFIDEFVNYSKTTGHYKSNRHEQDQLWFDNKSIQIIYDHVIKKTHMNHDLQELNNKIQRKEISVIDALKEFQKSLESLIIRNIE